MTHQRARLAAVLAAAISLPAAAADYHDRPYFDLLGSHVFTGASRQADNDGGYAVGFGMPVGPQVNLELTLQDRDYRSDLGGWLDHRVYSLDALFMSDREAATSPFLMLGLGRERLESVLGSSTGYNATLGVGVISAVTDNIALRADVRYQQGGVEEPGDLAFHLGLRFLFGAVSRPAPAPAAPVDGDADRDGVRDSADRCPGTPYGTSVGADGCPLPAQRTDGDADGDGIPDSVDRCPGTPAGARVTADGCETDTDGDGVVDRLDRCPATPQGQRVDGSGCVPDSDGDGVSDAVDACPGTPPGTRVDGRGCPLAQVIRLERVTFETGSANITAQSRDDLAQAVATLRQNPDVRVEVAGHTDAQGNADLNRALSQRRADAVRQYLIDGGVPADQLTARGYGEDEPVASNDTPEGRSLNRRVELRVQN